MLRLGYQGCEFLESGRITLPMPETERQRVIAVRRGEVAQDDVLVEVESLQQRIADLRESSPLPPTPDAAPANAFLIDAYQRGWALYD
jgi:hypothetical protein